MTLIRGVDASFSEMTEAEARRLRESGVEVFFQCLWTGAEQPAPRVTNLRNAINAGFIVGGYISVTGSRHGDAHVRLGRAGVPDDIWEKLCLVPIDVELDGIPNSFIRDALEEAAELGKRKAIYTSYNAWVNKQGNPTDFTDALLWNAYWDEQPDIDFPSLRYGGWQDGQVCGEQWSGGTDMEGVFVDRDTFVKELLVPAQEQPMSDKDKQELERRRAFAGLIAELGTADKHSAQRVSNALAHYLGVRPTV